jgi:hypothetical protein
VPPRPASHRVAVVAFLLAASLGTAAPSNAEDAGDLGTDCDAFTPCTHTVAPGTFLSEGSSVSIDIVAGFPTNNYPEYILRVGATTGSSGASASTTAWARGETSSPAWRSPSVVLRVPCTSRWEVHAEWFGNYTAGLPGATSQPFVSPGTHYLLTKNLEIGLRVGWGLNGTSAPFFSDAGLAWRY